MAPDVSTITKKYYSLKFFFLHKLNYTFDKFEMLIAHTSTVMFLQTLKDKSLIYDTKGNDCMEYLLKNFNKYSRTRLICHSWDRAAVR